ncbi:MAG: hypothetical protein AAFY64_02300 [Pseudomonadota bacterium]
MVHTMSEVSVRPDRKRRRVIDWLRGSAITVILICAFTTAVGSTALAQDADDRWMSAEAIRSTFSGKTITGAYTDGRRFSEQFAKGGDLSYVQEDGAYFQGAWSVVGLSLCTIYDSPPGGACFYIRKVSSNCYAFHASAQSREEARTNPSPRTTMTAQAAVKGPTSTCVAGQPI